MNQNHEQESDFERRLRTVPADDAPRPEHRDALRQQALAAFDQALQTPNDQSRWQRILVGGRNLMKRRSSRYAAAASILLAALAWLFWPGANSAAVAFSRMVDAVASARSAHFQMEVRVEGQPKQTAKTTFLAPAKYRMELDKVVSISDFEAAKMLTLMSDQKQAVVFNLKNAPKDRVANNLFEELRRLLREPRDKRPAYERLGEKMIDGRKAVGFRMESNIGATTLWGDPKTGHPIRIENVHTGVPRTEVVMSQFEMNPEVNVALLAQDIPKDYKVQSFDIDASQPKEADFVESLRLCAEMSGGAFPDNLDTQSVVKLLIGTLLKDKKEGEVTEAVTQQLMNQSIKIGRGFQFALGLPASAKAHYAGKGVKKDAKDRPIFWYLPEGAKAYRVIDATLTVRDAAEAPRIEGAQPLGKKAAAADSQ
jgi:outer membrane lipoprotein-sorting protein